MYIVLRGRIDFNTFFTSFNPEKQTAETCRYSNNGELWYDVVGVVPYIYDAWVLMYGKTFADNISKESAILDNKTIEWYKNN